MKLGLLDKEHGCYLFYCPGCKCYHYVHVYGVGYPDTKVNRWDWNGSMEKPTFRPSLLVNGSRINPNTPRCHSFVTDGKIEYLSDCTHELAGTTVEIPEEE